MVDWTDEKIAALSNSALKTLLANAENRGAELLSAACRAELEKRGAHKLRVGAVKPRTEVKEFERAMSEEIAVVGKQMATKYDLSEETAKAQSKGVKGFRAHKLIGGDGRAKLGGLQRTGFVAIERYISYRTGADVVSLAVFLPKNENLEKHSFLVTAPQRLLENAQPIDLIRDNHGQKPSAQWGRKFKDLPSAVGVFDNALAQIAVRNQNNDPGN